jgi:hypothetical protein
MAKAGDFAPSSIQGLERRSKAIQESVENLGTVESLGLRQPVCLAQHLH